MFGSEKKRQEKLENARRRIEEAGLREQERINQERAERAEQRAGQEPGGLHKIGYLDTKLNEREEKKGVKRVERAQKREAKMIRKENNRKYWWLALVIFALVVGGVGGFLLNGHMNHKADYEIATDLIIAKDFKAAAMILDDLNYKDSKKLDTYVQLRTGLDQYDGHLDEYLAALEELGSMDNKDIDTQFKTFVEKVRPAGEIQKQINELDIASLSLADAKTIEDLDKSIENLSDRYQSLLDTKKLQEAKVKIATLQEAADQFQKTDNKEKEPTDANTDTTDSTDANTDNTEGTDGTNGGGAGSTQNTDASSEAGDTTEQ